MRAFSVVPRLPASSFEPILVTRGHAPAGAERGTGGSRRRNAPVSDGAFIHSPPNPVPAILDPAWLERGRDAAGHAGSASVRAVVHLQRLAGNRAVSELLSKRNPPAPVPPSPNVAAVVQRAPTLADDGSGEYVDPNVPGFRLIRRAANDFTIKGSSIRVLWDPASEKYTDPSGVVVSFESGPTSGPTPLLEMGKTLPLRPPESQIVGPGAGPKTWQHFELAIDNYKRMDLVTQMYVVAELACRFGSTPYELEKQQGPRGDRIRLFRYHKFPMDPTAQQLVFGGGINKTEITAAWHQNNLKSLLKTRYDLLKNLHGTSSLAPAKRVQLMQKFQANAMSTPFLATTSDRAYAEQLVQEYPPTSDQRAVILVIEGPLANTFDFEAEFAKLGATGGGKAEWDWRLSQDRAKDAGQKEFGIPDLFIPMGGVSPLGFQVVDVIETAVPSQFEANQLSVDQRMQIIRAKGLPKESERREGL